ncbi:AbrB family transcriptional regulator [Breoghania sp.]|uniref:AbrB family transcriptional regulator n=1 Tax=Breoghania sp. TaxID=2065378 RepID=UPI0029CA1A5E|nr:AbrB family transcriptional regulator [Breoghania sp.]
MAHPAPSEGDASTPADAELHPKPARVRDWARLTALTLAIVVVLELLGLPASILLGAMVAAIIIALRFGQIAMPRLPYMTAQALIGCMIAHALSLSVMLEVADDWPIFVFGVVSVLAASLFLGWSLARMKTLPGTTAIWGSSPGAAQVMTLMSEEFGADIRLVAFMQYTRVIIVAGLAAVVARIWADLGDASTGASTWFALPDPAGLAGTLGLVAATIIVHRIVRLPSISFMFPMVAGAALLEAGWLTLELPPLLLAAAYVAIGWTIGLRFDATVLRHAARATPRILIAIVILVGLCGALSAILVVMTGIDPLTAYLAMSPGGADTIAIITASAPANINVPFVMAMQMARFLAIMLTGPFTAQLVSRWMNR